jgi:hypothetical protein
MSENLEPDEELQAELVRRVLALEGREDTLRLNNEQLETTIEALDDCTGVSRDDIQSIARDLSRSSTIGNTIEYQKRQYTFWPVSRLQAGILTLLALACIKLLFSTATPAPSQVLDQLIPSDSGVGGTYHKKALLGSAMADIASLRMMMLEYYYSTGEFPKSVNDLGLDSATLVSSHVTGLTLEPEGILVAHLPESLGRDKRLKLVPHLVMGGSTIEWKCYANLSAAILANMYCENG